MIKSHFIRWDHPRRRYFGKEDEEKRGKTLTSCHQLISKHKHPKILLRFGTCFPSPRLNVSSLVYSGLHNCQKPYDCLWKSTFNFITPHGLGSCQPYPVSSLCRHIPNCFDPASMHCLTIRRYRGSKMCSGQGCDGNAKVQTKIGTSSVVSLATLSLEQNWNNSHLLHICQHALRLDLCLLRIKAALRKNLLISVYSWWSIRPFLILVDQLAGA